ncbi:condensation domain-containing protein [Streptomyces sp. ACA25]|uniref:condensation domain-containing protein n=1 Tax=Streptomyces sp. ACA25 TaxID=3022596 RepID=UPI0023075E82|nr:condensation domain-containing protein [Streptomyces sp. ACA25]MDB1085974.1 condensation domain-containing protein [Streptomyces sp. ACA25]
MIPLSYAQRRLWFLNRLEGPSATYNVPVVLRLDGVPDRKALNAAVTDVARRHEVLRTVFPATDGEPGQQILPAAARGLTVRRCSPRTVDRRVRELARQPFDISGERPFRAELFVPGDGSAVLVLLLHHIATDGWSLRPLLRDLDTAYRARLAGRAPGWAPLPVQYADYTLWQHDMLGDAEDPDSLLAEQLAHWRDALDGLPAVLDLPADRPRPAEPTHRGASLGGRIDAETHRGLLALSRARGASLFMVARSALAVALSAAGAGQDLAIGTAVAGRPEEDLHELVGFFVNTLVLRTDLSGDPTVGDLVDRVREADLTAFAYEDLPFDLLVEHLNPDRSLAHHPFFQVMLTVQTGADAPVSLGGISGALAMADLAAAKFDLTWYCTETQDPAGRPAGMDIGLQYATDLFDTGTARLLVDLYERALRAFAAGPGARLGTLDLLSEAEHHALTARHDRLAAVNAAAAAPEDAPARAGGLTPRAEILCGLFAQVLGREDIGPDDSFFRVGGHSLLATKLINRVRAVLGVEVGIRDLFLAPTVRGFDRRIDEQSVSAGARPPLRAVPEAERPERLPLSSAQRRLWFINELEGPGAAYTVPIVLRLDTPLDPAVLAEALADVTERHEVLRTVCASEDGKPYQRILSGVRPRLDLLRVPGDGLAAAVDEATGHVFDLAGEIPFRAWLADSGDGQVLVLLLHHIAADGWSTGPLLRDLDVAYRARLAGHAPGWAPLPVQYADYTLWQEHALGDPKDPGSPAAGRLGYWREQLAGSPPLLELPGDRPRPAVPSHRGEVTTFGLDAGTHRLLTRLAHAHGATLFMVVQAALAVTLTRHGAGTDLPLGTVVAGRDDDALDDLVGFFVNTLVLRTDTSGDPRFADLVERVRDTDLAAYARQDVPFDRLVEDLSPHRSPAHHPFTQIMLQVHPAGDSEPQDTALAGTPLPVRTRGAKVDLTFALTERRDASGAPAGMDGVLEYATDLYDARTAALLAARLTRVLDAVAADPDGRVADIDLLSAEEQREVLAPAPAGRRHVVLDDRRRPVPAGVPGELYVSGTAREEVRPPRPGVREEPPAKSVPDPSGPPGSRLRPTGDRAVRTAAGELRVLGRSGERAELGGYPVDLPAVARVLERHPSVARAVAVLREDRPGERRLVAYVMPGGPATGAEPELMAWAAGELPEYTVPSAVVTLATLPTGADGRVDRRALPAPGTRKARTAGDAGARTPYEESLIGLFAEVLEGRKVGVDDNFFRVGGHSLLAVRLVNRVRAELGAEITLRDVFKAPTVAALAALLIVAGAPATPGTPGTPGSPGPGVPASRPTLRRRTKGGSRTRDTVRQP